MSTVVPMKTNTVNVAKSDRWRLSTLRLCAFAGDIFASAQSGLELISRKGAKAQRKDFNEFNL